MFHTNALKALFGIRTSIWNTDFPFGPNFDSCYIEYHIRPAQSVKDKIGNLVTFSKQKTFIYTRESALLYIRKTNSKYWLSIHRQGKALQHLQ